MKIYGCLKCEAEIIPVPTGMPQVCVECRRKEVYTVGNLKLRFKGYRHRLRKGDWYLRMPNKPEKYPNAESIHSVWEVLEATTDNDGAEGENGMKVKIERECCEQEDLKPYQGKKSRDCDKYYFCVHCGQIWYNTKDHEGLTGREKLTAYSYFVGPVEASK